jgi:hypothetical protein
MDLSFSDAATPDVAPPEISKPLIFSELLSGTGLIYNASTCHITTSDMQTLPELSGTTQTELHTPRVYLPTKIPIMTDYEIRQLNDVTELNSRN